jgi:hypothetical protein
MRSFLLGGLLGASAVLATVRRRRASARSLPPAGLAAFEDAPCFQETLDRERLEQRERRS